MCDTIDSLLGKIAYYWNLDDHELAEAIAYVMACTLIFKFYPLTLHTVTL